VQSEGDIMLHVTGGGARLCDGMLRREFLQIGGLALSGLTLPGLLRAQTPAQRRVKRCLQLFMWGGPAQQETFDLKPDAPAGIRSLFRPVATRSPGIHICEHLPRLAQMTDRYAILRSVTHTGVNHGTSAYHMLTGHIHFTPGTLRHPTPNDYPHVGCAAAQLGRKPANLPGYVALPSVLLDGDGGEVPGQGPGVLGQRHDRFLVQGDPTRADFSLETLTLPPEVTPRRLQQRMSLQEALERHGESIPGTQAMAGHYERAYHLLQSPRARRAFDLAAEPARSRDGYGWHQFGQSCLLARRLLEADVPLVTVYWNSPSLTTNESWDTHVNATARMREHLLPALDRAMSVLLEDLHNRGLLDDTLVMWMGEFGRTPRININGGRDHWGFCQSVLLAGAGVRGGQVYGRSDGHAAYAAESPVSPDDLAATVFHTLGIPLDTEIHDAQGRPLPLCTGRPVLGVF
jgi:hypothetical protein